MATNVTISWHDGSTRQYVIATNDRQLAESSAVILARRVYKGACAVKSEACYSGLPSEQAPITCVHAKTRKGGRMTAKQSAAWYKPCVNCGMFLP